MMLLWLILVVFVSILAYIFKMTWSSKVGFESTLTFNSFLQLQLPIEELPIKFLVLVMKLHLSELPFIVLSENHWKSFFEVIQ